MNIFFINFMEMDSLFHFVTENFEEITVEYEQKK